MNDVVYVVAKLQAKPGKVDALHKLVAALIEPTLREKGCRRYSVLQGRQNPEFITLLEEWDSEADLDTHLALPHLKTVFGQLPDLLGAAPDIVRYKLLG